MRAILLATLLLAFAPRPLHAQEAPPQERPTPPAQVVTAAPAPVVVYLPYVVFVPVVPAHRVHRPVATPPSPAQGIFAGKPATGIFAGQPATGIFVAPPPPDRRQP